MRAFLSLALYSLRMFIRDRGALFWGILFPVLLMGLVGLVFGNSDDITFNVSVVDETAGNPLGEALNKGISSVPVFKVTAESREEAMNALRQGKRTLVVVLGPSPGGSGEAPRALEAYYDETRSQISQAALAILDRVVVQATLASAGLPLPMSVNARGVSTRHLSAFDFLLPGIVAMTVMQTGLMAVSWVVATYREKLVLKRVLATPVKPLPFIAGLIARFTIVNLFQAAVIVLIGVLLFKAKVVGSLLSVALLTVVGSITFLSMGFAVATVSKTAEAAGNLGSLVNFPMMFLSGTFWPREMIPQPLQPLISALPLTPLVEAMRAVAARGEPLTNFLPGIGYLLLWAAAGLIISSRHFRWE